MRHRQFPKQCPTCGTSDKKKFGRNGARADGKQVYCKNCRKKLRGNVALTLLDRAKILQSNDETMTHFLEVSQES